jgi:adenylate cyclase
LGEFSLSCYTRPAQGSLWAGFLLAPHHQCPLPFTPNRCRLSLTMSDTAAQQQHQTRRQRRLPRWLTLRNTRLVTGLILFAFVTTHLANHALGLVSLEAMEAMRDVRVAVTRSLPGTALLMLAGIVHAVLGVEKIISRRLSAISVRGLIQIGFGLLIPVLLARHLIGTRIVHELYGINDNYDYALWAMWPAEAWRQAGLILLVWVHGCIGLYMWIRFRPWYKRWQPLLMSLAALWPILAFAGFEVAGRFHGGQPPPGLPLSASQYAHVLWLMDMALYASLAFIAVLVVIKAVQMVLGQFKPRVSVTYNSGDRKTAPAGLTLLEISRLSRVPHASMCGGRARCSTCRVQVLNGLEFLERPGPDEQMALERAGIDAPDIRLACQVRPRADLSVVTLVPAAESAARYTSLDRYQTGVERDITIMFVDIRGFTRFSDGRLPYDIVFILNQYLGRMSDAIIAKGGYVDKFMGDGIMALFGMETGEAAGARAALAAAAGVSKAVAELNKGHVADLSEPMRIGIGIHTGECILGRIGASAHHEAGDRITALGDAVNTASRLEGHSKTLGVELVVSHKPRLTLPNSGRTRQT